MPQRRAVGATPHPPFGHLPLKGKAHCRVLFCRQRFHECVAANNLFFFLRRKKKREKERPLRGFRREVRFIMSPPGKRRHNELNAAPPPETPGERASRERQLTEAKCTAENVSVFGAKTVRSTSRAARFHRAVFNFKPNQYFFSVRFFASFFQRKKTSFLTNQTLTLPLPRPVDGFGFRRRGTAVGEKKRFHNLAGRIPAALALDEHQ